MARFLIELPHESDGMACAKAIEIILKTGAHFFSRADWGCKDGEHKAWLVVEVDSREEAQGIVPPAFRSRAKIVQLNAFSLEEIQEVLRNPPC
jgi:hypothetical protein